MNITAEENLTLRRFCQEITYKPRPMDAQPSEHQGSSIWCEDWEMIEILKYLFLGEDTYFKELPPRRLRNNPLWSKEAVKEKADKLMTITNNNITKAVDTMRGIRNDAAASRIS